MFRHRKGVGDVVWLTAHWWEGEPPDTGDFLITKTGRCYQIAYVRECDWDSPAAYRLRCRVLEDNAVSLGEPGVFAWEWGARERR